jgi:hypothetical protein
LKPLTELFVHNHTTDSLATLILLNSNPMATLWHIPQLNARFLPLLIRDLAGRVIVSSEDLGLVKRQEVGHVGWTRRG